MTGPLRACARCSFSIFLLAVCLSTASAQITYTITDLGTLGGNLSIGEGINASGDVTGLANTKSGGQHPFLYSGGTMHDLGLLPGYTFGHGQGMNDSDEVTGFLNSNTGPAHAFLYSGGAMQDLGTLGGSSSLGQDINAGGQVVGFADVPGNTATHAFLYSGGTMQDLGTAAGFQNSFAYGINDSGQVTGYLQTTPFGPSRAFLYSAGTMTVLGTLGGDYAFARAINAAGQIAGSSTLSGNIGSHAALFSEGAVQDLGSLVDDSGRSGALGINSSGDVVGFSAYPVGSGYDHAFLYTAESGMVDLNSLLPRGSGWILQVAYAINDAGQITGVGVTRRRGIHAYLLTPPPLVELVNLIRSLHLPFSLETSLVAELRGAQAAGSGSGAYCTGLAAFIRRIQSMAGTTLTTAQADQLITLATELRTSAHCY